MRGTTAIAEAYPYWKNRKSCLEMLRGRISVALPGPPPVML
jgi:hypothetical protein